MSKLNLSAVSLRWRIVIAFAAVYLIWGSTYLAIRFAIETIPPYLMGGVRFLIAGGLLYAVLRLRGVAAPTRWQWRATLIAGGLLLFGGNGGVMVAEQFVPSSLAALVIATVPLWMVLLNWKWGDRVRPTRGVTIGVGLGVIGIGLIAAPGSSAEAINPVGTVILIVAALSWSIGSLYSRRAALPSNALLSTAMEMLMGGGLMLVAGLLLGQGAQIRLENVTLLSVASLGYLVIFGSLLGFTAYVWLLKVTTPAKVATYAFVNPVVAVFLGWLLAGETLSARTLIAAAIIIGAVVLITLNQGQPRAPQPAAITIDRADNRLAEIT
ncbi:MAG: drug/metabolite exporter YedA [Chloroflexi bacterium]|nr:drug/metabolite exporter YedA [Chloroflexota bacterium]